MLPACRTEGESFSIPTFDVVPNDVEGFMDALQKFQAAFHDCFTRSEPRAHLDLQEGICDIRQEALTHFHARL